MNEKKIVFKISAPLAEQVDEAIRHWGFPTRAAFFRFAAMEFMRSPENDYLKNETLREHAKIMRMMNSKKSFRHRIIGPYSKSEEDQEIRRQNPGIFNSIPNT